MADKVDENDLVSILSDICRLLSRDPLTMDEATSEVVDLPLIATVEPEPGTDTPAYIRLTLREPGRLTLDVLQKAFGDAKKLPRMHRRAGDKFIFIVDWTEYPYTCALIAETPMDEVTVNSVVIRRDMRLE